MVEREVVRSQLEFVGTCFDPWGEISEFVMPDGEVFALEDRDYEEGDMLFKTESGEYVTEPICPECSGPVFVADPHHICPGCEIYVNFVEYNE